MAHSLLEEIYSHVFGRKYYCVLLSRPNLKVKDTNGKHPFEMSCDIFFTLSEAEEYYQKMHDDASDAVFNTHGIVAFRTRADIPHWNMQIENNYKKNCGGTLLY